MNTNSLTYVCCLHAQGRRRLLLWQPGGNAQDSLVVRPGSHRLVMADSRADLEAQAVRLSLQVSDEATVFFDIDAMLRALAGLRDGRASSISTCKQLLDGWNLLEDLARSLDLAMNEGSARDKQVQSKAYQKLFWGNNLPAVTPEGKTYLPLFLASERRLMRRYLRGL